MEKHKISIIIFFLTAIIFSGCSAGNGILEVSNRSKDPVSEVLVSMCDQSYKIEHLDFGDSKILNFKLCEEGYYDIKVQLSNGKNFEEKLGYLASLPYKIKDKIVISEKGVTLEREKVEMHPFLMNLISRLNKSKG